MTTFSATDLNTVPVNGISVFLGDPFLPDRKQLREGMFQDEAGNEIEATDEGWERSYAEELVKAGQLGLKFLDAGWRLSYNDGARAILPEDAWRSSWKALIQEVSALAPADTPVFANLADGRLIIGRADGSEPTITG